MKQGEQFEAIFIITPKLYEGFMQLFNVRSLLFTDVSYAQSKGFESIVMQNTILNGLVSHFAGACLPGKATVLKEQSMKFLEPVYLQDTLRFKARINMQDTEKKLTGFDCQFINQSHTVVAQGTFLIQQL